MARPAEREVTNVKTTGAPCGSCKYFLARRENPLGPCSWCISDEDISLYAMGKNHPVDFVHYEPVGSGAPDGAGDKTP